MLQDQFEHRGRRVRDCHSSQVHVSSHRTRSPRQPHISTRELTQHEIEMLAHVFAFRDADEIVAFANRLDKQAHRRV